MGESGGRIRELDLLRGWGLLGVLWSNLDIGYAPTAPVTFLDRVLRYGQTHFIAGRFYTLLVLLFGIGFGLQLIQAADRAADPRSLFYRRTLALLGFGVFHATLLWSGDILALYALVALSLVLFRDASPKALLAWAAFLSILGPLLVRNVLILTGHAYMIPTPRGQAVLAHGSWWEVERVRFTAWIGWLGHWGLPLYPRVLAGFLTGLWTIRSGWLDRVLSQPKRLKQLFGAALLLATVGYASSFWVHGPWAAAQESGVLWITTAREAFLRLFDWATVGSSLTYAAGLLLVWQYQPVQRLLRPLELAGRMSLTTYITQSVVCSTLFYGYGFGWYGQVSYSGMLAITIVLFGCQMAFSSWWFRRHRVGPLESVWRRLTYGRAWRVA